MHVSRTGIYRLLPPLHRHLGATDREREYVASSAVRRWEEVTDYDPGNLGAYLDKHHHVMDV
jgi:hypothetical protein